MAHDELKPFLTDKPGRLFVTNTTHKIYKWATKVPSQYYSYRVFDEFTIRYSTEERTRLGLALTQHYRIDAVLFIEPGYRSLNQGQTYTVGLEIKGSISDLKSDEKLEAYVGWTNYFFIAVDGKVPSLINEAIHRASSNDYVGVMDIRNGTIHKMPARTEVPLSRYVQMLQTVLYHYCFDDSNSIIINNVSKNPLNDTSSSSQEENTDIKREPTERTYRRQDAEAYRKTQSEIIQAALETVDPTAQKVYEAINNGTDKTVRIAEEVGISTSAVANATASLKKAGLVERLGGCRNATYIASTPPPTAKFKGKCLKCELYKASLNETKECDCTDCL